MNFRSLLAAAVAAAVAPAVLASPVESRQISCDITQCHGVFQIFRKCAPVAVQNQDDIGMLMDLAKCFCQDATLSTSVDSCLKGCPAIAKSIPQGESSQLTQLCAFIPK
ncbi:uncharacterized protein VTP21DRAFT_393 [Calcarisporiella thermophila]|uniref:uncharacterized protein n=1 Tax=Calcarisporiella thermophila TaxID=911321 RepID=UPI003742F491